MRHLIPLVTTLALCLGFGASALAQQDVTVQAQAEPRVVGPGGVVTYTVSASVEGNYDISLQAPPDISAFQLVGSSQAPSFMVRGGQATRSLTLTYQLRAPRQSGEYTIGSPRLVVGTRTFTPAPIDLRVTAAAPPPEQTRPAESAGAQVVIEVEPDRPPYVGEQITLRYVLLTDPRGPRYRARHPDDPDLDDFWVIELNERQPIMNRQVQRDGQRYLASTIRTMAAFPLRPGPATLDGLDLPLVRSSFFGSTDEILARGVPQEIEVQPLPEGSPPGFAEGNVGTWQLSAQVDSRRSQVGAQITITARVENLKPGGLRHADHRFEWTRSEFRQWADRVAAAHGYQVTLEPLGEEHPEHGPPSQMAVFTISGG